MTRVHWKANVTLALASSFIADILRVTPAPDWVRIVALPLTWLTLCAAEALLAALPRRATQGEKNR